jgi:hypothetical protein
LVAPQKSIGVSMSPVVFLRFGIGFFSGGSGGESGRTMIASCSLFWYSIEPMLSSISFSIQLSLSPDTAPRGRWLAVSAMAE